MSEKSKKSAAQIQEELLAKAIENTVALNPLVGVSTDDIKSAVKKTAKQAAAQPSKVLRYSKRFGRRVADILKGTDEYDDAIKDRRFSDPSWEENVIYRKLKQAYFAWDESLDELVDDLDLDGLDLRRAKFVKEVLTTSMSPTNFLLGNPKALRKVVETKGNSLIKGLKNYVNDLQHNHGMPSQVDKSKFRVGVNLATTEGSVVYRNEQLELIQYRPRTSKVYRRPLLIVPPQINKFYIYDLTPEKSFFRFCLEQGFQVFVISWRNPVAENRDWGLDEYVTAASQAIGVILDITRSKDLNVVGACAGGITSSILSSYLKETGRNVVNSLSLSVCMLSMKSKDTEMSVFTSPSSLQAARIRSREKGVLEGPELSRVFNWMRPNDLVWNYHVNNYLMGEAPPAFDILFWNSDSTNLPAQLHCDFLDLFEHNLLEEGEMEVLDTTINLRTLDCDKYVTAGLSDHITPWKVCYQTTQFVGGNIKFVLSSSGHIQSLVNPPGNTRARYYCNEELPESPDIWLEHAEQLEGSWWTDWSEWLKERSGERKTAPRNLGNRNYPTMEAAPGTYVYS
ncbi:alpha/beta fold hydrolase [Porticoccus litoralis]|uniref:Alpha/beta fold hydrolase n=1 Tax=Porticoccus litoralis TaxID=434086 RepID=A0AAW8B6A7_9GAMM|nr:alpha/beta fold hydrolase [Porticoccus litoralis]MDP1520865.1 alpha/beta fold hydrolase [Porticoccus litoralis]TNE94491.1 MAG: alpha/beta fold hydrolase [Gammaproteobacteria bacterium]